MYCTFNILFNLGMCICHAACLDIIWCIGLHMFSITIYNNEVCELWTDSTVVSVTPAWLMRALDLPRSHSRCTHTIARTFTGSIYLYFIERACRNKCNCSPTGQTPCGHISPPGHISTNEWSTDREDRWSWIVIEAQVLLLSLCRETINVAKVLASRLCILMSFGFYMDQSQSYATALAQLQLDTNDDDVYPRNNTPLIGSSDAL